MYCTLSTCEWLVTALCRFERVARLATLEELGGSSGASGSQYRSLAEGRTFEPAVWLATANQGNIKARLPLGWYLTALPCTGTLSQSATTFATHR